MSSDIFFVANIFKIVPKGYRVLLPDSPEDGSERAPLPMGNDRAKVGQRSGQFSKTIPGGYSSNPGSGTKNKSCTSTIFAHI